MSGHVLVADHERVVRKAIERSLMQAGFSVCEAARRSDVHRLLDDEPVDVLLVDLEVSHQDGGGFLADLRQAGHRQPVILMSGGGDLDGADLEAKPLAREDGAVELVQKPLSPDRVVAVVQSALRDQVLVRRTLDAELAAEAELLGSSPVMKRLRAIIARVAPTEGRVLITGPNGTGKELVARAIHAGSSRRSGPFVKMNCAAVPSELIESELFGHERGAFTGAVGPRVGRFELADGGSLFLDEIGEMPLAMQPKLLRVLQEGEIERVGGSRTLRTDVRVLAATNRDLFAMMQAGTFREDLYYRLAVLHVATPALDEHPEDIPELARRFVERSCRRNGRTPLHLTAEACELLAARSYRGHVRELQNLVERLVILCESLDVDAVRAVAAMPESSRLGAGGYRPGAGLRELTLEAQRSIVEGALRHHQGNMTAAARDLGLERSHLYKKCRALGVDTAGRRRASP